MKDIETEKFYETASKLMSGELKGEEIDVDAILKKICVSRPYFAFEKIYKFEDILMAKILPEQEIGMEQSAISITEAGRHLAILGSCCYAEMENEKSYYLANIANMHILTDNNIFNNTNLTLFTKTSNQKRDIKNIYANGLMYNEDKPLFFINVGYQKLSIRIFERLFKKYFYETKNYNNSPYKKFDKEFEVIGQNQNTFNFCISELGEEFCAGHFNNYPMIPVSVSAYLISRAAGKCFEIINKRNSYIVKNLNLEVFSASSPFEKKELVIKAEKNIYDCTFLSNGIKEMHIVFDIS